VSIQEEEVSARKWFRRGGRDKRDFPDGSVYHVRELQDSVKASRWRVSDGRESFGNWALGIDLC
jgi:hypothetical protein